MRAHRLNAPHVSRLHPLAACLALALGAGAFAGSATADSPQHASHAHGAAAAKSNPDHPAAQTRVVKNCSDGAIDSLRDIITNANSPNHAQSGDTVDLGQLPMLCGMADSTITLTSGEIAIGQTNLTLQGPTGDQGTVTISGGGAHRVFKHLANGTLSIHDLTIANGYYHTASNAYGGCIEGLGGSIYLRSTTVADCTVLSDMGSARGGGVHNTSDVTLVLSNVSGNQALAPQGRGYGGGVAANNLFSNYSSISHNVAGDGAAGGSAGGALALAGISMLASTVDHNTASYGGGLMFQSATIILNSTISGNTAHKSAAALYSGHANDSLTIANSTIAFNHAETNLPYGAVHFGSLSASSTLALQSSIIANNTAGAMDTPSDLSMMQPVLSGADNLVIASSLSPPGVITVTSDPHLGPLQFNGGTTRTHALLPGSPALGLGNHDAIPPGITTDQRGAGYPRTTGSGANVTTDIGAFEFDTIFSGHFESN